MPSLGIARLYDVFSVQNGNHNLYTGGRMQHKGLFFCKIAYSKLTSEMPETAQLFRKFWSALEPEIHYCIHTSPTTGLNPELAQTSPSPHILNFMVNFNSILPSTPRSSNFSFSFRFSD
jgi:hypothetical protein